MPSWRPASAPTSRRYLPAYSVSAWRLAAFGGIAAAPVLGLYPGMDAEILIPAFIVIVIGGMGSLRGAFVGSLLIGICDTFGKAYFQSIALFLIYLDHDRRALDPAAGPVRHQVFRRRGCAGGLDRQAGRSRSQTRVVELAVLIALVLLPFVMTDYPRALVSEIFHLRDLRHEPRSDIRLHRPDVAWPRRVFRIGRLCGGHSRRAIRP